MEIFFDNHRSSPLASSAKEAFSLFSSYWVDATSEHFLGEKSRKEISFLLKPLFELVQAEEEETALFSGRKEEVVEKLISQLFLEKTLLEGKNHFFVSSKKEYPAIWKKLEERGCLIWEIPREKERGLFDLGQLEEKISSKTALIMIPWAESFSGILQPVEDISLLCREKQVDLYVDATFCVGKTFLFYKELSISFLHFELWPLHALSQESFFLMKKPHFLSPHFSQKKWSIPLLAVASAAFKQALLYLDRAGLQMGTLRDLFEKKVLQEIPGAKRMFEKELRLPNTSVFYFPKIPKETLAFYLNQKKMYIPEQTPLLDDFFRQIGKEDLSPFLSSFSFSRYTTEEQIHKGVTLLKEVVEKLKLFVEAL